LKTGFIGLGIMGAPMAGYLLDAGQELWLHDLAPLPAELLDKGATVCNSNREVAKDSDVIIVMVPDTPDVEAVLFGPAGLAEGLAPGKTVVDMSTISPTATRRFAERINELGCDYLDAPVSGGPVGAVNAALTIMVGGPARALERVRPLFEIMGKTITHIGEHNGAGQICKAANQIIVGITVEAVAEALVFAAKAGADPATVRAALLGGAAGSPILELHGQRMLERNFEPGFRTELQQKDLEIALQTARELGISLPATANAQQIFNGGSAADAKADHSAVVKVIERLADHDLTK
jgi:2-hydroxy-3-oxopropionate reductase